MIRSSYYILRNYLLCEIYVSLNFNDFPDDFALQHASPLRCGLVCHSAISWTAVLAEYRVANGTVSGEDSVDQQGSRCNAALILCLFAATFRFIAAFCC